MILRRDLLRGAGALFASSFATRDAWAAPVEGPRPVARALIVLWMNGGPSHLDTWDPKPGTRTGGPTKVIKTKLPGLEISAAMPLIADVADRLCVVRGMTSKEGNHVRAQYLGHTTYSPSPTIEHPSLGAWLSKKLGGVDSGLPAFVSLGGPSFGPGFLGAQHGPFIVQAPGTTPASTERVVGPARFEKRLALLDSLEKRFSGEHAGRMVDDRRAVYESARRFMASPALRAFDVSNEGESLRAAYGDSDFGRACLTARNLVRAGVRHVEVTLDGWDTHTDNFGRVDKLLGIVDPAMSALLRDLETTPDAKGRPLAESTIVAWMGDFGRSPRINSREGRDHYPKAYSAVLAGAGIKPGIIGGTDATGENVVGKGIEVADFVATVVSRLGLSPTAEDVSPIGRPIAITNFGRPLNDAMR